jgi:large subunit ribosomal protein L22
MEVRAVSKNVGISARKMRLITNLVKGKKVDDALALLKFTPTPRAEIVAKCIKSAAANAENNFQLVAADLKVHNIVADTARMNKRFRARSRGQASPIHKHSSHITVIVSDQEG